MQISVVSYLQVLLEYFEQMYYYHVGLVYFTVMNNNVSIMQRNINCKIY